MSKTSAVIASLQHETSFNKEKDIHYISKYIHFTIDRTNTVQVTDQQQQRLQNLHESYHQQLVNIFQNDANEASTTDRSKNGVAISQFYFACEISDMLQKGVSALEAGHFHIDEQLSLPRCYPLSHFTLQRKYRTQQEEQEKSTQALSELQFCMYWLNDRKDPYAGSNTAAGVTASNGSAAREGIDGSHTLVEAIENNRRITNRNLLRWVQQLLNTILVVHNKCLTVGDFGVNDVMLQSDRTVLEQLHVNRTVLGRLRQDEQYQPNDMEIRQLLQEKGNQLQEQVDEFTAHSFDAEEDENEGQLVAHVAAANLLLRGGERNAWLRLHNRKFNNAPQGSPRTPLAEHRNTLVNYDARKNGGLVIPLEHEHFDDIVQKYRQWAKEAMRDYRSLGLIILQMYSQRFLNEREEAFLQDWVHIDTHDAYVNNDLVFLPTSPSPSRGQSRGGHNVYDTSRPTTEEGDSRAVTPQSRSVTPQSGRRNSSPPRPQSRDANSHGRFGEDSKAVVWSKHNGTKKKSGATGDAINEDSMQFADGGSTASLESQGSSKVSMAHKPATASQKMLHKEFPHLFKLPDLLKALLEVCFAPIESSLQHGRVKVRGTDHLKFEFSLLSSANFINKRLQEMTREEFHVVHIPKQSLWTEEDVRRQRQKEELRKRVLAMKAEVGMENTHRRIRIQQFKLWYSLQSDEYKAKRLHRKRARQLAKQHKTMWRKYLFLAKFHFWRIPTLQKWVMDAIVGYGKLLLQVRSDVLAKKRKKLRPEVYETRLLGDFTAVLHRSILPKLLSNDQPHVETGPTGGTDYDSIDSSSVGNDSSTTKANSTPNSKLQQSKRTNPRPQKIERSPSIDTEMVANIVAADFGVRPRIDGRPREAPKKEQLIPPQPSTTSADNRAESSEDRYEDCFKLIAWHISQQLFEFLEEPLLLSKYIRMSIVAEEEDAARVKADKKLVTSEMQQYVKRMMGQCTYLSQFSAELRNTAARYAENIRVIDRSWIKGLVQLLSGALLHKYHEDAASRSKGEGFAADRLIAFFRGIFVRKLVSKVWQQTEDTMRQKTGNDTRKHKRDGKSNDNSNSISISSSIDTARMSLQRLPSGGTATTSAHNLKVLTGSRLSMSSAGGKPPIGGAMVRKPSFSSTAAPLGTMSASTQSSDSLTVARSRSSATLGIPDSPIATLASNQNVENTDPVTLRKPLRICHLGINAPHSIYVNLTFSLQDDKEHRILMQQPPTVDPGIDLSRTRTIGEDGSGKQLTLATVASVSSSASFYFCDEDLQRIYNKYEEWQYVTTSAYLVVNRSGDEAMYNAMQDSNHATLSSKMMVAQSSITTLKQNERGDTALPPVPPSVSYQQQIIVVFTSQKQAMIESYAGMSDYYKSHPEKYVPVNSSLLFVPNPGWDRATKSQNRNRPDGAELDEVVAAVRHPPPQKLWGDAEDSKKGTDKDFNGIASVAGRQATIVGSMGGDEEEISLSKYSIIQFQLQLQGLEANSSFSLQFVFDAGMTADLMNGNTSFFNTQQISREIDPAAKAAHRKRGSREGSLPRPSSTADGEGLTASELRKLQQQNKQHATEKEKLKGSFDEKQNDVPVTVENTTVDTANKLNAGSGTCLQSNQLLKSDFQVGLSICRESIDRQNLPKLKISTDVSSAKVLSLKDSKRMRKNKPDSPVASTSGVKYIDSGAKWSMIFLDPPGSKDSKDDSRKRSRRKQRQNYTDERERNLGSPVAAASMSSRSHRYDAVNVGESNIAPSVSCASSKSQRLGGTIGTVSPSHGSPSDGRKIKEGREAHSSSTNTLTAQVDDNLRRRSMEKILTKLLVRLNGIYRTGAALPDVITGFRCQLLNIFDGSAKFLDDSVALEAPNGAIVDQYSSSIKGVVDNIYPFYFRAAENSLQQQRQLQNTLDLMVKSNWTPSRNDDPRRTHYQLQRRIRVVITAPLCEVTEAINKSDLPLDVLYVGTWLQIAGLTSLSQLKPAVAKQRVGKNIRSNEIIASSGTPMYFPQYTDKISIRNELESNSELMEALSTYINSNMHIFLVKAEEQRGASNNDPANVEHKLVDCNISLYFEYRVRAHNSVGAGKFTKSKLAQFDRHELGNDCPSSSVGVAAGDPFVLHGARIQLDCERFIKFYYQRSQLQQQQHRLQGMKSHFDAFVANNKQLSQGAILENSSAIDGTDVSSQLSLSFSETSAIDESVVATNENGEQFVSTPVSTSNAPNTDSDFNPVDEPRCSLSASTSDPKLADPVDGELEDDDDELWAELVAEYQASVAMSSQHSQQQESAFMERSECTAAVSGAFTEQILIPTGENVLQSTNQSLDEGTYQHYTGGDVAAAMTPYGALSSPPLSNSGEEGVPSDQQHLEGQSEFSELTAEEEWLRSLESVCPLDL